MRVLLVEDDPKISAFIREGCEGEGWAVEQASDGQSGLELALTGRFDLIVLDLTLPKLDGIDLLARVRAAGIQSFVVVLTARGEVAERVRGLDVGADEYMVKPFSFAELSARVRRLFRRQPEASVLRVGPFSLDRIARTVTRDGVSVELTAREFQLFSLFMENPDTVLPRSLIAERVWGYNFDTGTNVIDVYVNYLRRKLGKSSEKFLVAVRGVGYTFRPGDCVEASV